MNLECLQVKTGSDCFSASKGEPNKRGYFVLFQVISLMVFLTNGFNMQKTVRQFYAPQIVTICVFERHLGSHTILLGDFHYKFRGRTKS